MVLFLEEIWENLGDLKREPNFKFIVTMDSFNHWPNQTSHLKKEKDVLSLGLSFVLPILILYAALHIKAVL
jgi:hypothetical protein